MRHNADIDNAEMRLRVTMERLTSLQLVVKHMVEESHTLDDLWALADRMQRRKEEMDEAVKNYYKALLKGLTEGEP